MTAKPLKISLGLLNALQVAIAAAAGFAAALLIVVPAAQPGTASSPQEMVDSASRAYVAAIAARHSRSVSGRLPAWNARRALSSQALMPPLWPRRRRAAHRSAAAHACAGKLHPDCGHNGRCRTAGSCRDCA